MKPYISRREFFRKATLASLAATPALTSCSRGERAAASDENLPDTPIPTDRMTLRTNSSTGDKVSVLGYGAVR